MKGILLFIIFLGIVAFNPPLTPDVVSFQSGNWNDASTWSPAIVPDSTKVVQISVGHVVTLTNNVSCKNLIVNGTKSFAGNYTIYIKGQ